jgi:hypothetical protein
LDGHTGQTLEHFAQIGISLLLDFFASNDDLGCRGVSTHFRIVAADTANFHPTQVCGSGGSNGVIGVLCPNTQRQKHKAAKRPWTAQAKWGLTIAGFDLHRAILTAPGQFCVSPV